MTLQTTYQKVEKSLELCFLNTNVLMVPREIYFLFSMAGMKILPQLVSVLLIE